jgi:hypothetical protein
MATVIRSGSSVTNVTKKQTTKSSVLNVRQPTTIGDMSDTSFGVLDDTKDGLFVTFNNITKKFELTTADILLERAAEDGDIADPFIRELEDEINLGNIEGGDIDGGGF